MDRATWTHRREAPPRGVRCPLHSRSHGGSQRSPENPCPGARQEHLLVWGSRGPFLGGGLWVRTAGLWSLACVGLTWAREAWCASSSLWLRAGSQVHTGLYLGEQVRPRLRVPRDGAAPGGRGGSCRWLPPPPPAWSGGELPGPPSATRRCPPRLLCGWLRVVPPGVFLEGTPACHRGRRLHCHTST